jgi:SM-20-related protein
MNNIINNVTNIDILKNEFSTKHKTKITNFLNNQFSEMLFQHIVTNKDWSLATGIDSVKYEKKQIPQNDNANNMQMKKVNSSFGKDHFTYIFYRSMNNVNVSYFEFTIRKVLNSFEFINILNDITGLQLTKLNTLFLSRYKASNFLSPHSDKGNGRLAFVLSMTKNWKPQYGGVLHFMNDERTEITESVVPSFNNFFIFHIPGNEGVPHFVSHVSPNVIFSRYAITGWFE